MKFEEYIDMLVSKLNCRLLGQTVAYIENNNGICTVGTSYYNNEFGALTFSMVLNEEELVAKAINVNDMADLYVENLRKIVPMICEEESK